MTQSAQPSLPYLGSKISLISNAGIRYEGVLFNINTTDSTVGLKDVHTFGTEGRKPGSEVAASDEVYDYIVFRGKDIQDLTVSEPAPPDDPAIVAINPMPTPSQGMQQGMGNDMHYNNMGNSGYMMGNRGPNMSHRMDYGHHMGRPGGMYGNRDQNNYQNRDSYQPRRGNYQSNYMRNSGYGYGPRRTYGPRRIIGELSAQPNQSLKSQLEEAFDFDEANRKFDKPTENATTEPGKENEADRVTTPVKAVYDKKSSFFDHISCETLDRQTGYDTRIDRTKQRQLDVETFGQAAAVPIRRGGRGYHRGGYRRGGGMGHMGGHHGHMGGYQQNYPFYGGGNRF